MKGMQRIAFTLAWLACAFSTFLAMPNAWGDERILDYRSDVAIQADGSLVVSESIRVVAEGNEIRRGITRDFPTRYKDRFGNHYNVKFDVESVSRDGDAESWHSEKLSNGTRIYIGSADYFLPPGAYTYTIRFRTNRQLGFFPDHDELYWNAIGIGWVFPIDHASASISLPFAVPPNGFKLSGYTGLQGSTEASLNSRVIDERTVEFEATRPLGPQEGLTVVVGWPKSLIKPPSTWQKIRWFGQDNGAAIVLLLGLVLSFIWYYLSWNKVGRDPRKGVIIPRFESPTGLSPSACRYVLELGFVGPVFTAAIINLAVKGYVRIEEEGKEFTLHRIAGNGKGQLTPGEAEVLKSLLPHSPSSISLTDTNHARFQAARAALDKALKSEYRGRLFNLNSTYLVPSLVITVLVVLVALGFDSSPAIWITWIGLMIALHVLFAWLLHAPTPAGRQVMDEIEGFRMYLDTAEQDRLDRMRSPALTPEVFESFLPYAYALGVENHWCERFARELPSQPNDGQASYQPGWYSGQFHGMSALNHLGDNFSSSFSSAISSASSPPGSSSGGGGGGSSGGGGGGGGGGGW